MTTNEETPRQSQFVLCARCGQAVGDTWVYLQAISLARRLYVLDTCGPCWDMLRAAIALELAGAGPGGHREVMPASAPSATSPTGVSQVQSLDETPDVS